MHLLNAHCTTNAESRKTFDFVKVRVNKQWPELFAETA